MRRGVRGGFLYSAFHDIYEEHEDNATIVGPGLHERCESGIHDGPDLLAGLRC